MKFTFLLLCTSLCTLNIAHANVIDSLTSKEDVKSFLNAKLGSKGIFLLNEPAILFRPEKKQIYAFSDDTVQVKDEFTGKVFTQIIPHDPNSYQNSTDTLFRPVNYSLENVFKIIDQYPLHFYKTDIDGNGYTDLVIDAGIVIIVMDMGDRIEGHIFSDNPKLNSYGFKNFLSLPDRTFALLLRHDYNSRKSIQHSSWPGAVTFVTRKLPNSNSASLANQIDTLYKVTTGIDSENHWVDSIHDYKKIAAKYVDTVDMHLYNTIDTLVYKFHGFAKYNRYYKAEDISKIIYRYSVHDGTTSDMSNCMEIKKNGKCLLDCMDYSGNAAFSSNLGSEQLKDLWNYISYINVRSMQDEYVFEVDHGLGVTFVIYFNDNTFKEIFVLEEPPPMELAYLSKSISDICKTLSWLYTQRKWDIKLPDRSTSSPKQ